MSKQEYTEILEARIAILETNTEELHSNIQLLARAVQGLATEIEDIEGALLAIDQWSDTVSHLLAKLTGTTVEAPSQLSLVIDNTKEQKTQGCEPQDGE